MAETTRKKTYLWLNELAEALGTSDRHEVNEVLCVFLHTLRDRLQVGIAVTTPGHSCPCWGVGSAATATAPIGPHVPSRAVIG